MRTSNLSRIQLSQVKQDLRFKYSDLEILYPTVVDQIKKEIQADCPELITDGSKPFQAVLMGYETDHVAVTVNCHFHIPPTSSEFADNRQNVFAAINRAVKMHDIEFALPSIYYETKVISDDDDKDEPPKPPFK